MSLREVQEQIRRCYGCLLCRGRRNAVPGHGSPTTKVAFIGEAPGWKEDGEGLPFIGPAGEVLDSMLSLIGLKREEVYLLNVQNCRPPNNRDPLPKEMDACRHWIEEQLVLLPNLRVVAALGRYASLYLCPDIKPADLRGTARYVDGLIHFFLLHPAATLHQPNMRPELERGFRQLGTLI